MTTFQPRPADAAVERLRREIDDLDEEILRLVKQRTEVSRKIGVARLAAGGTRIVHSRELAVLRRYAGLGQEGRELALLLLRLGRGRLGAAEEHPAHEHFDKSA